MWRIASVILAVMLAVSAWLNVKGLGVSAQLKSEQNIRRNTTEFAKRAYNRSYVIRAENGMRIRANGWFFPTSAPDIAEVTLKFHAPVAVETYPPSSPPEFLAYGLNVLGSFDASGVHAPGKPVVRDATWSPRSCVLLYEIIRQIRDQDPTWYPAGVFGQGDEFPMTRCALGQLLSPVGTMTLVVYPHYELPDVYVVAYTFQFRSTVKGSAVLVGGPPSD
ncbi:MAG: hypothetical protein PHU85_08440, partial [Phycisphaerae bacterium]|nr:hypothetical protein [Phycisphaerae bacterium]